MKESSK